MLHETRLSDLQLELGLQTSIKRHNQVLHYNSQDISDLMSANDMIFTHIKTTEDQPLALLPTVHSARERQAANIQRILRKSFHNNNILIIARTVFMVLSLIMAEPFQEFTRDMHPSTP